MLNPSQVREAAELLTATWNAGTLIDDIPESCRPRTRAQGYQIQAELSGAESGALFGWKIAATSAAGQQHIHVDGPLAGRLFAGKVFESGVVRPVGPNRMLVAEPEFAFRMGVPVAPRSSAYTTAEVVEAVESLHPAIEIPDSRFRDFTKVGAAQLIADDACAREFVLGPATDADWRSLDLARHAVRAEVRGRLQRAGEGANVLGSPLLALTWLANELSGLGITLERGQVVTTGTCMAPLAIGTGGQVAADFGELGSVSMTLG